VGRFAEMGIARRERIERDRAYFEDADDDGREAPPETRSAAREDVLANIRALAERARVLREAELAAEISGERAHPDAPHPDPRWRARSRHVFRRMVSELYLHVAPWHHHEIWTWAASHAAGTDWVEREVAHWERRVAREEARRRAIRDEFLLPLGEPVDDYDVE